MKKSNRSLAARRRPRAQATVPQASAVLVALGLLCSSLLVSQERPAEVPDEWRGAAGLVVSVVNDEGAPLPDVRVAVRLGETPEWLSTTTEDDGRARFEGLAEGEWEVDVRREGFMLFSAFVALESGRKPKVAFSSRQRTGTYWEPLQAVFLPADVELTRGMASGRQSVDQALAEQRRRERREETQERRARRAAKRGDLARVEETGPVREPVIRDLVEPTQAAPTSEPADEGTRRPVETVESNQAESPDDFGAAGSEEPLSAGERDAPLEPAPDRTEAPNEAAVAVNDNAAVAPEKEAAEARRPLATTAEPRPGGPSSLRSEVDAPAEPPVAPIVRSARFAPRDPPRRLLANPNLRPAGACPECAPGEFSVASRGQAERWERGSACGAAALDELESLAVDLVGALDEERRDFAGSLRESNGNDVLRLLPDELRSEVLEAVERTADSCALVGVVLPAGARYVGFRYQVGERSIMAECPDTQPDGSQACQLADARWLGPPRIVERDGVAVVLAVFENRSRRSTRLPQLVVYFEPARGWLPPSE